MSMDIFSVNYQPLLEKARKDLKEIENRGVSKAETLEDLRDTKGKSFRTADLEKLMEKYDPEAYAQYSKFAKRADGARTQSGLAFLSNWMDGVKKKLNGESAPSDAAGSVSKGGEAKLSSKAQAFLKKLRKQYGGYDFFVGGSTDNLKSLVKSGTKEFSVIFSNAELERMAEDETYAQEKLQSMERAINMSREINQQFGFKENGGTKITKIGIAFQDDGTTSYFAELEKSSAKQRERIEKAGEEKRAKKKEEEKNAKKELQNYAKNHPGTKHTTVQADTMEELIEKIKATDWDAIKPEDMPEHGRKFDFSI